MNALICAEAKNMTVALKLQGARRDEGREQSPEVRVAYEAIAGAIAMTGGSDAPMVSCMTSFSKDELDRLGGF